MSQVLPESAHIVIVGGGVIGTSIAYHLAHAGLKDVVLLEKDQLTSGTTWHAAGLMVTFGSTSETSTELRKYTRDLYARLESETGLSTGLKQTGFIEAATDSDRLEEYRRVSAFNRKLGIDVQEISPAEIKALFPLADVDMMKAGFYVADDGRVNPVDCTMAMAKGARQQGAKILEGVTVQNVTTTGAGVTKQVTGVVTDKGTIKCDIVVNAAGMWARQFGERVGVNIPNQAAEHYYLITGDIPGMPPNMPVLEVPSHHCYLRDEGGGLMIGLFEPICAPWKVSAIPEKFSFGEIPPDWDRMAPYLEKAMSCVPITLDLGIRKFFCGPESFTPDLSPIIGESPEIKNFWVCAGLNSIGILTGGGLGHLMAQWIIDGHSEYDVTGMHIDRLQTYQNTPRYRAHRTVESLGMVYQCHYPYRSLQTARGCKKSPFYDRLKEAGAYFKDVSGFEGADWYAPAGERAEVERLSWGREKWFDYWAAEHRACREGVILMDMSFMAKFLVQGRDAGKCLNWISANNVDTKKNQITYTQWLNRQGKLEADLTVTKLDDEKYFVVVTDTQLRHAETLMKRNFPADAHAFVTDMTGAYGQLNIQGPRSRELMQALTDTDMSNEAFPFRHAREISIGYARVLCVRITYLGELGYELYIPSEQALHVYDEIVEHGKDHGLVHAGLKALSSLRMEKGYRDYGHDIDNTDNPFETGLGFAVSFKKEGGFIGRQPALAAKEAKPYKRRLLQVLCKDPDKLMFHAEIVYRNDRVVGHIRAASYGHTLGGAVGLAMIDGHGEAIDNAWVKEGRWEVDIAGTRYPAEASIAPMYDPNMERIKS